jgi:hypothetical protein
MAALRESLPIDFDDASVWLQYVGGGVEIVIEAPELEHELVVWTEADMVYEQLADEGLLEIDE